MDSKRLLTITILWLIVCCDLLDLARGFETRTRTGRKPTKPKPKQKGLEWIIAMLVSLNQSECADLNVGPGVGVGGHCTKFKVGGFALRSNRFPFEI